MVGIQFIVCIPENRGAANHLNQKIRIQKTISDIIIMCLHIYKANPIIKRKSGFLCSVKDFLSRSIAVVYNVLAVKDSRDIHDASRIPFYNKETQNYYDLRPSSRWGLVLSFTDSMYTHSVTIFFNPTSPYFFPNFPADCFLRKIAIVI